MKKLTLLLAGLAIAITASAGVQFKSARPDVKNHKFVAPTTKMIMKSTNRMTAPVTEQPAGEMKTYTRTGEMTSYSSWYGLSVGYQSGKCYIVYADDGQTIYMKDPVCGYAQGAWVEGTIDGNIISIPLGQSLYWSDTYQCDVVLAWGTSYTYEDYDEEGNLATYIGMEFDDRATVVEYEIDGQTISMLGSDGDASAEGNAAYNATGLCAQWGDDLSWTGAMDWKTVLTEREPYIPHGVIMDQPEGQVVTYTRGGEYVGYDSYYGYYFGNATGKVNAVWGPNRTVYIQDPFANVATGAWVQGEIDETYSYITIPLGQYIYENTEDEWGAVMGWGHLDIDEEGYVTEVIDNDVTEAIFAFDAEDGTLTLVGGTKEVPVDEEGYVITPTTIEGLMCYYSDDLSMVELDFGSTMKEYHLEPAVPANPTADEWYDCGDESGFSRFYFTLPTEDVNGNYLDPEYLSYSVYTDNDQIFTFEDAVYSLDDLYGDLTEIPYWLYSDAIDFRDYFVYLYRTNAEGYEPMFEHRIGIQAHYTVNGVKNSSDIVYLEVFPDTKVNELNAGKTVANVRYYNVAGQEMAQPEGLTIQVTTYTDGTTSASKVVK
jgi:hypothetical protein